MIEQHNIEAIEASISAQFHEIWAKLTIINKYKYPERHNEYFTSSYNACDISKLIKKCLNEES